MTELSQNTTLLRPRSLPLGPARAHERLSNLTEVDLTVRNFSELERTRIHEFLPYPPAPVADQKARENFLNFLSLERRKGYAIGFKQLHPASMTDFYIPGENKTVKDFIPYVSKSDFANKLEETMDRLEKNLPSDQSSYKEMNALRFQAIGLAEAYWMEGRFADALRIYKQAGWLDADVPASKIVPDKLKSILLDQETEDPQSDTVISGIDLTGKNSIFRLSPEKRNQEILDIRTLVDTWKKPNPNSAVFSRLFPFLQVDANRTYSKAYHVEMETACDRLLELNNPDSLSDEEKTLLFDISTHFNNGFIPDENILSRLRKITTSYSPLTLIIHNFLGGISKNLAVTAPDQALDLLLTGVTNAKDFKFAVGKIEDNQFELHKMGYYYLPYVSEILAKHPNDLTLKEKAVDSVLGVLSRSTTLNQAEENSYKTFADGLDTKNKEKILSALAHSLNHTR